MKIRSWESAGWIAITASAVAVATLLASTAWAVNLPNGEGAAGPGDLTPNLMAPVSSAASMEASDTGPRIDLGAVVDEVRRNRALAGETDPSPIHRLSESGDGSTVYLGGDPVIGIAIGEQYDPAIAFGTTNYLAVWVSSSTVYGARVTTGGVLLDSLGIAISAGTGSNSYPDVAFDGTNYLVVWEHASYPNHSTWGARVAADGTVLDPSGIAISGNTTYDYDPPAVASNGTHWIVVWSDKRSGNGDIYAARVAPDGTLLDASGVAVSSATGTQRCPAVATYGEDYLVVWQDYRDGSGFSDIYGARVTAGGSVLDPSGLPIYNASRGQYSPAVAFALDYYLVVWACDTGTGTGMDIRGRLVDLFGAVDSSLVNVSSATSSQTSPAVAFDGTNYTVVWEDRRGGSYYDIYATRVATNGVVLDSGGKVISTATNDQQSPAVAFCGTSYMVVWDDRRNADQDIYCARVSKTCAVLDASGIVLVYGPNIQSLPKTAFDGTNYLVVWQDFRNGSYDIYGTRVSAGGTVLDPAGIAISSLASQQCSPGVAFDGTNYFVVWDDSRNASASGTDIYGARVSPGGVVLDGSGIAVCAATYSQYDAAVAFGGGNYLVVWVDYFSGHKMCGARVAPTGTVLDPSGIIISDGGTCPIDDPDVAFGGTNYLVVWKAEIWDPWNEMCSGFSDIYGVRVALDGTVLDGYPLGLDRDGDTGYDADPAVASDGTGYLVGWSDQRYPTSGDVSAVLVSNGGVVGSQIGVCWMDGEQGVPDVCFDGTNYFVIWSHYYSGSSALYAGRVSSAGEVLDSLGTELAIPEYTVWSPAVCKGASGQYLAAYVVYSYDPGTPTNRIWGTLYDATSGVVTPQEDGKGTFSYGNSPNPFAETTTIRYCLPERERVSAKVYDIKGELVRDLLDVEVDPGTHQVTWDGRAGDEAEVAPGTYFVRIQAGSYRATTKVVLVR